MTTKLQTQIRAQDQAELAERHNGTDTIQLPRRKWAVLALKPELEERQWQAAHRAVNECRAAFDGMRRAFDSEPVDGGGSDYGLAARVSASGRLSALKYAVRNLDHKRRQYAPAAVEWIAQLWTLEDMASAMGCWMKRGARGAGPDLRPVKPFVSVVLTAMADHYEGVKMNEFHMGVGEGWQRTNLTADNIEAIRALEGEGLQLTVTPAGAVFMRDPRQESAFQPKARSPSVAA